MDNDGCILFTAFEPSGDEHAAPVIAHLRAMRPDLAIYAIGGDRMAEAGATIIEDPIHRATMGMGAVTQIKYQLGLRRRVKSWLASHPVAVHVPTDSPAANWGLCKIIKAQYRDQPQLGRVVHLVAPQVWAWATWRVRRLQKYSDLVLCLLPFEPAWLEKHDVPARFIGHPVFGEPINLDQLQQQASAFPTGSPRLAILPGSRMSEIEKNGPAFFQIFQSIRKTHPEIQAMVASFNARTTAALKKLPMPTDDDRLMLVEGQTGAVLEWADIVLAVSGTASLHITRAQKPMVLAYYTPFWLWHGIGRWVSNTRCFTLPNLIALGGPEMDRSKQVIPEFAPIWGSPKPIEQALRELIDNPEAMPAQREALSAIVNQFKGHVAGREAAEAILEQLPKG